MKRRRWAWAGLGSLWALGLCMSCRADSTGQLGSETNWLGDCRTTQACAKGTCICGICTTTCAQTESCGGAVCAVHGSSAHEALCAGASSPPSGICVAPCARPADCGPGMVCVGGACLNKSTSALSDAAIPTDGGTGGADGAGGAGQAGGARGGSSPDSSAGPCNDVPEPRIGAQVQLAGGVAPVQSGGTIRDGIYQLDSARVYIAGTDGGVSIEGRAHTIAISGREWASVSYFDNAPTTRYNDEATLSGNSVSLTRVCGNSGAGILFGASGTYTASDSALVLSFAAGSAFGDGAAVLTFRRAEQDAGDADASFGGATCLGTNKPICTRDVWPYCAPDWSTAKAWYPSCDAGNFGAYLAQCGAYSAVVTPGKDRHDYFFYDGTGRLVGHQGNLTPLPDTCEPYDRSFIPSQIASCVPLLGKCLPDGGASSP